MALSESQVREAAGKIIEHMQKDHGKFLSFEELAEGRMGALTLRDWTTVGGLKVHFLGVVAISEEPGKIDGLAKAVKRGY